MLRRVAELLFPARCLGCRGPGSPFCAACARGVALLSGPGCRRCGRPLEASVDRCSDCPPAPISWARSAFLYEGPIRKALIDLKFGGLRSTAADLAVWMAPAFGAFAERPHCGDLALTWVPLGRSRRRRRGFDQARELASRVGPLLGLPVERLLARVVETAPQARRTGEERRAALRGAFRVLGPVPGRVVLVDDVLTSGATAAECARVLTADGASEVGVLTAARSLGGGVPARCYNPPGLQPGSVVAREIASR